MIRVSFVAALMLAASTPLAAQSIAGSYIQFGVMGGRTKPIGELSSAANNDWNFGGLILFGAPESKLRFRLDAQWQQMTGRPNGGRLLCVSCGFSSYQRDYRVLDATANAVFSGAISGSARAYLVGGPGVCRARGTNVFMQNALLVRESSSVTRLGLNAGVGVSFKMGRHAGFVEARYHDVFGDDSFESNGVTGDTPGSFQFVPLNVGFIF